MTFNEYWARRCYSTLESFSKIVQKIVEISDRRRQRKRPLNYALLMNQFEPLSLTNRTRVFFGEIHSLKTRKRNNSLQLDVTCSTDQP